MNKNIQVHFNFVGINYKLANLLTQYSNIIEIEFFFVLVK